jgi:hypothetical protein
MAVSISPFVRLNRNELAALLSAAFAGIGLAPSVTTAGSSLPVTSCADDGGPDTLRTVMMGAPANAVIDLTQLPCDTIVLTQGTIDITNAGRSATVRGPGVDLLEIDGSQNGGIFHASQLRIENLTLTNGRVTGDAVAGGCIEADVDVALVASRVTGCSAYGVQSASGGGIFAVYTIGLYSTEVTNNTVFATSGEAKGGGISANYLSAYIIDSTISGNVATGAGSRGGGIYVLGSSQIVRSTIDNNVADKGGGWYCQQSFFQPANCRIQNSTVSGNIARDSGGGLVAASPMAHIVIDNSTISFNTAQLGHVGGALLSGTSQADVTLQSSIFSNNAAGGSDLAADLDTDVTDLRTVSGGDDVLTTVGRIQPFPAIIADPLLAPLADNGGPTKTHALVPGSPAIDVGNDIAGLATDQRGQARVSGAFADIGAYELQNDAIFADGFD